MKRISILIVLTLLFAFYFPTTVLAHPGGTDANGGHYVGTSNSYHYHHGYPAHQHTDMNGDGTPDCPHDFEDKTNHQSRSTPTKNQAEVSPQESSPHEKPILPIVLAVCAVTVFFLPVLLAKEAIGDCLEQLFSNLISVFWMFSLSVPVLLLIAELFKITGISEATSSIPDAVLWIVLALIIGCNALMPYASSIKHKEPVDGKMVCASLISICAIIIILYAIGVLNFAPKASVLLGLLLFSIAWIAVVRIYRLRRAAKWAGTLLGLCSILSIIYHFLV